MTITAQNIAFDDNLQEAKLIKLGWNLCQNDRFKRNITDFCRNFDSAGDAKFSRVSLRTERGLNALRCAIYSTPAAETNVRHDVYVGPITTGDKLHIGFDAHADAAKTIKVGIYNTISSAAISLLSSVALSTTSKTHYAIVTATATANNGYVSFVLGGSTADCYLTNIRIYKEIESETLPKFQSIDLSHLSGCAPISSVDGRNNTSRLISKGATRVTVNDPFVDSDPMWWQNITEDKGREWQPGLQYLDGDFIEHPSGLWSTYQSVIDYESSASIVGENSMSVAGDTTTSDPVLATKRLQESCPGEKVVLSSWIKSQTSTIIGFFITLSDGSQKTDTMESNSTYLDYYVYSEGYSTNAAYFDALKIEREYYSPFLRQPTAYLWAFYCRYNDGTYNYHCLVPRIRWNSLSLPMRPSSFLQHTISGSGDQALLSRV